MIIFLYGEDNYRAKKKLDEIVEEYKKAHKSGLNLIWFDAAEKQFSDFMDNFKIVSMFAEKKLIILDDVFLNQKFQEDFLKETNKIKAASDIIIVFEKEKVDERTKLFKFLKKETKSQEFKLLSGKNLLQWIEGEFLKHGAEIDHIAKMVFLNRTGNNLCLAENEIKKLAAFTAGKTIKKEDVELMTRSKIESDIFKTIDAMAQNNTKQAIELLHKHIEAGDNVLYLFSMIAYQFRNLLTIKELSEKRTPYGEIAKKSGLHPFVVQKNYYLCQGFSFLQLKKIYRKIFQIDFDIKTGKIEPETALDLFVSAI